MRCLDSHNGTTNSYYLSRTLYYSVLVISTLCHSNEASFIAPPKRYSNDKTTINWRYIATLYARNYFLNTLCLCMRNPLLCPRPPCCRHTTFSGRRKYLFETALLCYLYMLESYKRYGSAWAYHSTDSVSHCASNIALFQL